MNMLRNIASESLYRLAAQSSRFDVYHPWQELIASQWLDAKALKDLRTSRLRNLLKHSVSNVPFYKQKACGIDPQLLMQDPLAFLNQLEITSRSALTAVAENVRSAWSPGLKSGAAVRTSGTGTGVRFDLKIDNAAFLRKYALLLRNYHTLGWRPGDTIYSLWPFSHEAYQSGGRDIRRVIADTLFHPKRYFPPMPREGLSEEQALLIARRIVTGDPVLIEGDGHYIGRLAEAITRYDLKPPGSLRAIKLATCPTPEAGRKRIAKAFNCPVFDNYGPHEMEGVALQCTYSGLMHLSAESYIAEIVDDDGLLCRSGEVGNLCLTDLDNRLQPLIRYIIGDVIRTRSEEQHCSCGRGLPLIGHVEGRRIECLETTNGLFTPLAFLDLMAAFNLENRCRMLRLSKRRIRLEVSPYRRDIEKEEEAAHALASALRNEYQIEVSFVPIIPTGESGKMRYLSDAPES